MGRRVLAYLFMALGFLTVVFFRKYTGVVVPYPSLFYILGFVLFMGGLLFLRFTPTATALNRQKQQAATIHALKANGERIEVDLLQCEIKEHHYTEERDRYGHPNPLLTLDIEREIQGWNALGGNAELNVKQVQVVQSVLVYHYQNRDSGNRETFVSRVIPKDKTTLSFYLDQQKQTLLYVDKTNRERYYFDLDFLNC